MAEEELLPPSIWWQVGKVPSPNSLSIPVPCYTMYQKETNNRNKGKCL